MKHPRVLFLILLLLVVSISACAGKDTEAPPSGDGIAVRSFQSDFGDVYSGESASITLVAENRGDFTASNVKAKLIRSGSFTNTTATEIDGSDLGIPLGDTYASDAFFWELQAPNVLQNRLEEVQAEISYDYESSGVSTVHFVPRDVLREIGTSAYPDASSSSHSPIFIDIVANQPVQVRGTGDIPVRFTVIFVNEGTGKVESLDTISSSNKKGDCTEAFGCIDDITVRGLGPGCTDFTQNVSGVKLIQGKEGRKSFEATYNIADDSVSTSCQVQVTAEYHYKLLSPIESLMVLKSD
ncbi:MAG: hypothetical protein CL963_03460 [Euryarchaeota archaeon]|nr:hypothetical protein [Euryarchaeota archaeon]|tara:strand:- start:59244 stop:60134 length:891 start_codon:yes stop_codon:yes gene_type:complete